MDKQTASHKLAVFVCISIQTEERGALSGGAPV